MENQVTLTKYPDKSRSSELSGVYPRIPWPPVSFAKALGLSCEGFPKDDAFLELHDVGHLLGGFCDFQAACSLLLTLKH